MNVVTRCKLCNGSGRYKGMGGTDQVCGCPVGIDISESQRHDCNVHLAGSRPLYIALAVRRNVEAFARNGSYDRSLKGLCAFASMALAVAYDAHGIKWRLHCGLFEHAVHTWLVHQTNIIDLTLTQFDRTAARVMVLNSSDSRFRPLNTFEDMQIVLKQPHGGGPVRTIKRMAKV
jgi:hypothetical protein